MNAFGWLEQTKAGAEVAKLLFEIWAMVTDRSRYRVDQDRRIKDLEAELDKIKAARAAEQPVSGST